MKLFQKMSDERLIAETNRIYKMGYLILTFGILADFVLQVSGVQLQTKLGNSSVNLLELGIFLAAQIVCIVLMTRKGMMDDNAFAGADVFPLKHYFLFGMLLGASVGVVRIISHVMTNPLWKQLSWPHLLMAAGVQMLFAIVITTIIFVLLMRFLFGSAKKHRDRLEEPEERK